MDSETYLNSGSTKSPVEQSFLANLQPQDRIYFVDKENSIISRGSLGQAVALLVLGVMIVLAFFSYLFCSTKFVNKRLQWLAKLRQSNESKNVDVDGDYLINGMYL